MTNAALIELLIRKGTDPLVGVLLDQIERQELTPEAALARYFAFTAEDDY